MDPLCVPQAYSDAPDAAAAELGASNCVRYLLLAAEHLNVQVELEVLDSLLEMLLRCTIASIAAPSTARYLLIGGIVSLLAIAYWDQGQSARSMPLQLCLDLRCSALLMGAAAAANLSANPLGGVQRAQTRW